MADNIIVTNDYRIGKITFDIKNPKISIELERFDNNSWNGQTVTFHYSGSNAVTLLQYINTANFSVNSFKKQLLNKLVTDGFISGTVS